MTPISQLLAEHIKENALGLIIEFEQVEALIKKAVERYAGYADLTYYVELEVDSGDMDVIVDDAKISESEWVIIGPLFLLYVELQNAIALEASRGLGVDVFGRATSEIQTDITALEEALPSNAFYSEVVTV